MLKAPTFDEIRMAFKGEWGRRIVQEEPHGKEEQ
jgi:hypothetical protein